MTQQEYKSMLDALLAISARQYEDPQACAAAALEASESLPASELSPTERAALGFTCSSIIINTGSALRDETLLRIGQAHALDAAAATDPREPLHHQCRYNATNASVEICDLGLPASPADEPRQAAVVGNRVLHSNALRAARREYLEIGTSASADQHTRSASLCNLANLLDHSGRWAEAYDYYLLALSADPENGNAAGNIAQVLMMRVESGVGQSGHIAALYDKYAKMAKSLQEGTASYAAPSAVERWNRLSPTGSLGHLSHGLDRPDAADASYRRWVARYRLALSPAIEGLGTEEPHWDTATVERLKGQSPDDLNPPLLASMNVLKADNLVSRRLAFDGIEAIARGPEQLAEDSGIYSETLDGALYGVQYSKLLLAQRAALDVLDKTAVVANEHFAVGETPSRVSFRSFWKNATGEPREDLVRTPGRALPALALAELASDMATNGMYSDSQALRNAGTHRIVHAAESTPSGVTANTRSVIDIQYLERSTITALQVTRSAYLYLIDLVATWNDTDEFPEQQHELKVPNYRHGPQD